MRLAVQRRLDRHASLGNLGQELGPETLVPNQGIGGVIRVDGLLLVHGHRLVQARASVPLQILAVGVRPEDERLPGDLKHHALAGEAQNPRGLARSLLDGEGQSAARVVAHERLAQAHHNLGVELSLVLGGRVDGVNDERVVGVDDGLHEDAHAQVVVVDAHVAQRHKRAIVPLGRPHIRQSAPRLGPAILVLGGGDAGGHHRSLDLIEHARGRGDVLDARAARGEGTLQRRLGGVVDGRHERRELSFDAGVDGVVENVFHGPEGDDHGLGEVNPGWDLTAAEALVEREGVDSLGAHDALLELLERDGELAAEGNLGELEALGHARDIAGARAQCHRGRVHLLPDDLVAAHDGGGHGLAV